MDLRNVYYIFEEKWLKKNFYMLITHQVVEDNFELSYNKYTMPLVF